MIFLTGDTHIPIDIHKLNSKQFPQQKTLTKQDYLIVCGDFGLLWDNSKEELYWKNWIKNKSYTTLFVDGNHENFELLKEYPIEVWNGGKVHKIDDSIYHLMRGEVFTIDNKKIFTMGGAKSHDINHRKEYISWWKEELPNFMEYNNALENLSKNNFSVDYVITHCVSKSVANAMFQIVDDNPLTTFFEDLSPKMYFKKWFFGHYHKDMTMNKYQCLYDDIIILN